MAQTLWNAFIILIFAVAVFGLGYSGWLFVLAVALMGG